MPDVVSPELQRHTSGTRTAIEHKGDIRPPARRLPFLRERIGSFTLSF